MDEITAGENRAQSGRAPGSARREFLGGKRSDISALWCFVLATPLS